MRYLSQTLSLLGLGFALTDLAGCAGARSASQGAAGPPPMAVTTARIQRTSLESSTSLSGQVQPYFQASVATETAGTVLSVFATLGDHVRQGQVLAKIDDAPLQAQFVQQNGAQEQAAARLMQSQTQQPITEQVAQSTLEEARLALTQAKQQLEADRAMVRQSQATYTADQHLLSQGYVASTAYEQARSQYVASQQTLSIDTSRVAQAEAALRSARRNLLTASLQRQVVAENRGALDQARGAMRLVSTQLGQTLLTAPFDGVVTQRFLDPGAYASPNQPIFNIAQVRRVYVTFNVQDADLAHVHVGTPVTFTIASHPERIFHGRVDVVSVVPTTGTLLYPARLTVDNADEVLRGGMLATVKVVTSHTDAALTVPRSALVETASGDELYAIIHHGSQSVAKRIPVTLGIETPDTVQVSAPHLQPGMVVITNKPDPLRDGAPVVAAS